MFNLNEAVGYGSLIKLLIFMEHVFVYSTIYTLVHSIDYSEGAVVSKIVRKNNGGNITLFAFDKGQVLSEHSAPFDAIIVVLDGQATISIDKNTHQLKFGEMIIVPANISHALFAKEKFKMMLIMLRN